MHRKRQNVYYVKLQEDISTLNADQEYYMTITSIYGPESVRFVKNINLNPQNNFTISDKF